MSQVHWFPCNENYFVVSGKDLSLYEIKRNKTENFLEVDPLSVRNLVGSTLKYVSSQNIKLLNTEIRYQFVKCAAPSNDSGQLLVAAGQTNGKVALCNFLPIQEFQVEFTPRQQRSCLCVSWSESENNLLAMGFDRNKSDHCITLWDVTRPPAENSIKVIGLSETAHSICWEKTSRILISGMSQKYIKIMDLRESAAIVQVANTRAVHGVSLAPNNKSLVSYVDNVVTLWDIRMFEKSTSQFQMSKDVTSVAWSPTRSSVISVLQRESPLVSVIELHWNSNALESDAEPHFIKRTISPYELMNKGDQHSLQFNSLDYLSWHPKQTERVILLSNSNLLCDFKIPERVSISFDNNNKLWSSVGNMIKDLTLDFSSPVTTPTDSVLENNWEPLNGVDCEDIAELMQRRVMDSYGQLPDFEKNGELAYNSKVNDAWKLLGQMHKADCFLGLKAILGVIEDGDGISAMAHSDYDNRTWNDFPTSGSIKVYRSEQRDFARIVSGWTFEKTGEAFINFIEEMMKKREYTRAAMLACFNLKVRYAIDILGRGADKVPKDQNALRISAIALSGFNVDKSGIWRAQASNARKQIDDPCLRAMFAFLAPDDDTFKSVLFDSGVNMSDRMAFACTFLSDSSLSEYVKKLITSSITTGDLCGLLLTGATLDGISLLQSYVDRSDDVQTAALIGSRILPSDLFTDKRMQCWIYSYRNLLDVWGKWEDRAKFDIAMGQVRTPPKSAKSVFLLCNFCGKSVSASLQEENRHRNSTTQPNKLSSCPNCRKPLPRCSLCLLHMGTTGNSTQMSGINGWKSKPFSKWFSWCQTCRHGGHTAHLADWFKSHAECPVTSCTCKCFAMDEVPRFMREIS